jgi:hypothetical protein
MYDGLRAAESQCSSVFGQRYLGVRGVGGPGETPSCIKRPSGCSGSRAAGHAHHNQRNNQTIPGAMTYQAKRLRGQPGNLWARTSRDKTLQMRSSNELWSGRPPNRRGCVKPYVILPLAGTKEPSNSFLQAPFEASDVARAFGGPWYALRFAMKRKQPITCKRRLPNRDRAGTRPLRPYSIISGPQVKRAPCSFS